MAPFNKKLGPSDSNGPISEKTLRSLAEQGDYQALVFEPKYDGSRYLLHLHKKGHHLTSRRISAVTGQFVEKLDRIPHFQKLKISKELEGVVLDMEIVSKSMKLNGKGGVSGMLNSSPKKARKRQKKYGKLTGMVFNMVADTNGKFKKFQLKPLSERKKKMKWVLERLYKLNPKVRKYLTAVQPIVCKNWKETVVAYKKMLEKGYEGLMIKDLREVEAKGMWKWKRFCDTCVIVTGFEPGTKKYKGQIGALKFSVYKKKGSKKLVEIGQCSGMTDKVRKKISKNFMKYKGQVLEVRAQEFAANGRLRHPRFRRFRDDYPSEKCTLEKSRKDMTLR